MESPDFDGAGGIPIQVSIDALEPSCVQLLIYCFTTSPVYGDYLAARESLVIAIRRAIENAGTSPAYPSRSVYVEKVPPHEKPVPDGN